MCEHGVTVSEVQCYLCVERLVLRCSMGLRLAPGLLIFGSAHTSIVS